MRIGHLFCISRHESKEIIRIKGLLTNIKYICVLTKKYGSTKNL